ncbi:MULTISPECIES: sodium:proton antiporter NhaD [unclassified Arcicella]|uniref:sodium:proton antiporter NhaD n=1 Tax=unclassified Arcicella TaxID=2644986 RepID=UPI002856413D|nr:MULTISPECIES: sodium:proton antiporter NhaD [unclassified Arcicella]MDR6564005.1 NhaD family Na+/H+ antiporter [Arcicella sp. BE51]MDR6813758.1 NhaD family Na+/H+ antiporter [Arcicella sp. BE140]MDR6825070.1 NhaD family Na+/H+ antiporter [Arcicella sp. BE139]
MQTLLIITFVIGYLAIAFEHPIHLNKTATALITGVLCWTIYILFADEPTLVGEELSHHLGSVSEILFFLLGAMTIVELIDAHHGFKIITDKITSKNKVVLLWIIALITFFLSAALDNLTTAIVMVSVLRKLIRDKETRMLFAGVVIIAANSGGAWSPIGDVTTTMLWIGGQVTATAIMKGLLLPSLVSLIVPLIYLSFTMKGNIQAFDSKDIKADKNIPLARKHSIIMLIAGLGMLLLVPVFKTVTHLPPYMGVLLGLGIVWVVSEILHHGRDEAERKPYTVAYALSKIDSSSILFFLGILLAIGSLEATHLLTNLASWMDTTIGNQDIIVITIGLASAIIDNVPLVAASMGMYDLASFPTDSKLWEFMAYCAGTGGSILIIGSASGVAVMGMEKIDFLWYLKKISFLALIGYFAGIVVYLL